MNIFNDINTQNLLFRFFYTTDIQEKSPISDFIPFYAALGALQPSEPTFVQFEPYKYGYNIELMFNIEENIELIKQNLKENKMVELLVPSETTNIYYRIGDMYGFKIVNFSQQFRVACPNQFTIKLKTLRPAEQIYEILNYTNYI
jgi:hypothetical protein